MCSTWCNKKIKNTKNTKNVKNVKNVKNDKGTPTPPRTSHWTYRTFPRPVPRHLERNWAVENGSCNGSPSVSTERQNCHQTAELVFCKKRSITGRHVLGDWFIGLVKVVQSNPIVVQSAIFSLMTTRHQGKYPTKTQQTVSWEHNG